MIRTGNGGIASVGNELCLHNTTREERAAILEREQRIKEWRRSLPRKRKPEHEKPGPITWVQL
ncbi:hypothetical protein D3C77_34450 [compost metagenome]